MSSAKLTLTVVLLYCIFTFCLAANDVYFCKEPHTKCARSMYDEVVDSPATTTVKQATAATGKNNNNNMQQQAANQQPSGTVPSAAPNQRLIASSVVTPQVVAAAEIDEADVEKGELLLEEIESDSLRLSASTLMKNLNLKNYTIPSTGFFLDQSSSTAGGTPAAATSATCISHCAWFRIDSKSMGKSAKTGDTPAYCSDCVTGYIQYAVNDTGIGRCFVFPDDFGAIVSRDKINAIKRQCLTIAECECISSDIRKVEKMTLFERMDETKGGGWGKQPRIKHEIAVMSAHGEGIAGVTAGIGNNASAVEYVSTRV